MLKQFILDFVMLRASFPHNALRLMWWAFLGLQALKFAGFLNLWILTARHLEQWSPTVVFQMLLGVSPSLFERILELMMGWLLFSLAKRLLTSDRVDHR